MRSSFQFLRIAIFLFYSAFGLLNAHSASCILEHGVDLENVQIESSEICGCLNQKQMNVAVVFSADEGSYIDEFNTYKWICYNCNYKNYPGAKHCRKCGWERGF